MKRKLFIAAALMCMALLFSSCQSKEDQRINDMESLVIKAENCENFTDLVSLSSDYQKLKDKYGREHLNFTYEQKAEMRKLTNRFAEASARVAESSARRLSGTSSDSMLDEFESFFEK